MGDAAGRPSSRRRCRSTPSAREADEPITDEADGDPSVTVVLHRLPRRVIVERVVQVTANRLLWVQVRSADRATANTVLDGVATHGL